MLGLSAGPIVSSLSPQGVGPLSSAIADVLIALAGSLGGLGLFQLLKTAVGAPVAQQIVRMVAPPPAPVPDAVIQVANPIAVQPHVEDWVDRRGRGRRRGRGNTGSTSKKGMKPTSAFIDALRGWIHTGLVRTPKKDKVWSDKELKDLETIMMTRSEATKDDVEKVKTAFRKSTDDGKFALTEVYDLDWYNNDGTKDW